MDEQKPAKSKAQLPTAPKSESARPAPSTSEASSGKRDLSDATSLEEVAVRLAARRKHGALWLTVLCVGVSMVGIWATLPDEAKMQILRSLQIRAPSMTHGGKAVTMSTKLQSADPELRGFKVIRTESTLDLRLRTNVPPWADSVRASPLVQTTRVTVVRTDPSAIWFPYEFSSSESLLDVVCLSHSFKTESVVPDASIQSTPHVRRAMVDLSHAPMDVPLSIELRTTFWNICKNDNETWFGRLPRADEDDFSFKVVFPDDKRFRTVQRFIRKRGPNSDRQPADAIGILELDKEHRWARWSVRRPAKDFSYQLWWEW